MIGIYVQSDIIDAGRHPEDGSPMEGIVFYVVAQLDGGRRFAHKEDFVHAPCPECIGISMYAAEEGVEGPVLPCKAHRNSLRLSRDEAEAEANKLCARVTAALATWKGPMNNPHWVEIRPAYGSAAWVAQDMDFRECVAERAAEGLYLY